MNWLETLRTGVNGVRSHRLRSFLTVLGILIGIAGVIIAVGLGEGASGQVTSEINALGSNVLTITPGSSTSTSGVREALGSASTLTKADVSALASPVDAPDIKAVAGITSSSEVLTAGSETATTTVQGTTPSWLTVRGRTVAQGRFLDNQDVQDHAAVVVLGETTASELFTRGDPVGQTVDVNGVPSPWWACSRPPDRPLRRRARPTPMTPRSSPSRRVRSGSSVAPRATRSAPSPCRRARRPT